MTRKQKLVLLITAVLIGVMISASVFSDYIPGGRARLHPSAAPVEQREGDNDEPQRTATPTLTEWQKDQLLWATFQASDAYADWFATWEVTDSDPAQPAYSPPEYEPMPYPYPEP